MAISKKQAVIVNDVPAGKADLVLSAIREAFQTYETGGGEKEVKVHETSFGLAGQGEFVRVVHDGNLAAPLVTRIEAFAAGVLAYARIAGE